MLSLIIQFINRLLKALAYIFAVKIFLPESFGYLEIAITISSIFVLLSTFGFDTIHLKNLSQTKEKNEAFTSFLIIKVFLIIFSLIIITIIISIQINFNIITNSETQILIIFIILIQYIIASFSSIYALSFQADMKIAKMKIPELISSIAYFVFSLIVIFIFQNFYLYLVANIIEASIKTLLLFIVNKEFKITKINFELVKKYIKSNNYFLIPIILNTFSVNIGVFFFLRYYNHDLLGIYSVITHFFLLLVSLENSFRLFLIPNLSSLYEKREFLKMEHFINGYKKYMLIFNSLIIIGGIIFSEFVINLFMGEIYYDFGLNLYYCNLLALLLIPLYGSYSPLIIATNKLKFYSLLSIITFIFSLISWIFFIPVIEMIGIKAGLWIYQIFGIFIIRKFLIKNYNIGKYKKDEIFHLIFLCIIIIAAFLISLLELELLLSAVSFIILSLIYFGFLYFSKYFTKEDFLYIIRSINPKEMVSYIKNETMEKK